MTRKGLDSPLYGVGRYVTSSSFFLCGSLSGDTGFVKEKDSTGKENSTLALGNECPGT
jgi:hypothetical protein